MYIRIPWIISRRRKLIASTIDYLVNTSLYNFIFFKEIGSYPSNSVSLSLGLFWIIVSYILGRYIKNIFSCKKILEVYNFNFYN